MNDKIKQLTTNNELLLAKLNSESYKFDNTSQQFKNDIVRFEDIINKKINENTTLANINTNLENSLEEIKLNIRKIEKEKSLLLSKTKSDVINHENIVHKYNNEIS